MELLWSNPTPFIHLWALTITTVDRDALLMPDQGHSDLPVSDTWDLSSTEFWHILIHHLPGQAPALADAHPQGELHPNKPH